MPEYQMADVTAKAIAAWQSADALEVACGARPGQRPEGDCPQKRPRAQSFERSPWRTATAKAGAPTARISTTTDDVKGMRRRSRRLHCRSHDQHDAQDGLRLAIRPVRDR